MNYTKQCCSKHSEKTVAKDHATSQRYKTSDYIVDTDLTFCEVDPSGTTSGACL